MDLIPDINIGGVVDDIVDGIDNLNIFDALDDIDLLDGLGDFFDDLTDDLDLDLGGFLGSDIVRGGVATDVLSAALGGNILLGLAGADRLIGFITDDLLNGGVGSDRLNGRGGDDILTGLLGKDFIDGGKGDDILYGGKGLDELFGGKGEDVFVLELDAGRDLIKDFRIDQDQLKLWDDIDLDDIGITQKGRDTLISYDDKTLAILQNVQADQISVSDFTT
jgi:Ca2+-binding RTX toxin-like protein